MKARAYLTQHEPALWARIERAGIAKAAVWSWDVSELHCWDVVGTRQGGLSLSGGNPVRSDAAWNGLPRKQKRQGHYGALCCQSKDPDPAMLAYAVNKAMAAAVGEPYDPRRAGSKESGTHARLLCEAAAQTGDLEALRRALGEFGPDDDLQMQTVARLAAEKGDWALLRDLAQGAPKAPAAMLTFLEGYHVDWAKENQQDQDLITALVLAGWPLPEHCKAPAALYVGQKILPELQRKRRGMQPSP